MHLPRNYKFEFYEKGRKKNKGQAHKESKKIKKIQKRQEKAGNKKGKIRKKSEEVREKEEVTFFSCAILNGAA